MVLVQKWPLFQVFLGNIGHENVFYDILEEKNAFLGYKTKKFKSQKKIDIFPKGLTHSFGPKIALDPICFLGNIGQENVFHKILERKVPFYSINTEVQKVKKLRFSQRG